MWFRRRRSATVPYDRSMVPDVEPATVQEMVSEGEMLAEYAARMALKNRIIITVLTEGGPYTAKRFIEPAKEVLAELGEASRESARLAEEALESAVGRRGVGEHQHDYRSADTANLRRRAKVNVSVADRIWAMRDDPDYLEAFIDRARDDAWTDIARAITASLDRVWPPDPSLVGAPIDSYAETDTVEARGERVNTLRMELEKLALDHEATVRERDDAGSEYV